MNKQTTTISEFPCVAEDFIRGLNRDALAAEPVSKQRKRELITHIKKLLNKQDAVLVAHYYTDNDIQELAEATGGFVSDSLDMARFGSEHPASTLIVAGVRFMGETAKILNPEKRILMPTLKAECSLDLSCPAVTFVPFCDEHPDRTVVVYANTSAEVKARADWVVTSSIGTKIVKHLHERGEKILWAPDKYLGNYIQKVTGADMLLWQGFCIVHDEFKSNELEKLRLKYPNAAVLVHPESPDDVIGQADVVGSTTALINAVNDSSADEFIVATDNGIFYKMQQVAPNKKLIEAPTGGTGASCSSCAHCGWMAMNGLENIATTLEQGCNEITLDERVRVKAYQSVKRMIDFSAQL